MKFFTTPYHFNLLKDHDRLSIFYEAISSYYEKNKIGLYDEKLNKIALDVGCGSGVLAYFASIYFKSVIGIDKDKKIINCGKKTFKISKKIHNINLQCEDVLNYDFKEKVDLIICEMLDTALIDEEEVMILNRLHKNLNNNGEIIPHSIINIAEPINMKRNNIHYEDDFHNPTYNVLGKSVKYSEFKFSEFIDTKFKTMIDFEIAIDSVINGIKITTFTKLNENTICGPTSMMNPSLFIPIKEKTVKKKEIIKISLEYIMGGGLETIKTDILN